VAVFENRRQVGVSGLQLLVSSLQLAMPRYNPEQLSRAESLGRELSASTSFADDDEWHEYQERVAAALAKPLPARGDSQRRTVWGAIAKAHKKMIAQLDADRAALVASSASGSRAMSAATKKRKAEATTTGVEASMAIAVSSLPTNSATLAAPPPPQALLLPQQMLPSFPSSSTGAEYGASLGDAGPAYAESVEAPLQDQQVGPAQVEGNNGTLPQALTHPEPASVMCAASHVMSCHAAPGEGTRRGDGLYSSPCLPSPTSRNPWLRL
jgi:hypothetical protein